MSTSVADTSLRSLRVLASAFLWLQVFGSGAAFWVSGHTAFRLWRSFWVLAADTFLLWRGVSGGAAAAAPAS